MDFGNKLRKLRIEANLNQEQLAEKLSTTKQNISSMEKGGRNPSVDFLIRVAEFFNVSSDYLLGLRVEDVACEEKRPLSKLSPFRRLIESKMPVDGAIAVALAKTLIGRNLKDIDGYQELFYQRANKIFEVVKRESQIIAMRIYRDKTIAGSPGVDAIFPQRLTEMMQERGIKAADLAKRLGVSAKSIYAFMKGNIFPTFGNLVKIANYLDVSTDYLLGLTNERGGFAISWTDEPFEDEIYDLLRSLRKMSSREREFVYKMLNQIASE